MCKVLDTQALLCVRRKIWFDFFSCDVTNSWTSYLFLFSSQKAAARMMRTPRMQAITTEATKPKKREKAYKTVKFIYLRGEC